MARMKRIGILTAGGDSPGLNAAIRAVGKTALDQGIQVTGFKDGFRGLVENRHCRLDHQALAGILTIGGTILGTARERPHRMFLNGEVHDMTGVIAENFQRHRLDALVCIGGGGTHKSVLRLIEMGLPIVTLPKTIDNDLAMTDTSIGFDTAMGVATDAIDRLHSTAHSHHRIIVAELMGHRAGWLALGAGIAGGADVILVPEIPYDVEGVAEAIRRRAAHGVSFSIVAVAEGAVTVAEARALARVAGRKARAKTAADRQKASAEMARLEARHDGSTWRLSKRLERLTGLEARVSILGYVQRGGAPSALDRLLATRLGTKSVEFLLDGCLGVMVAVRGDGLEAVPVSEVAGRIKTVPTDHPWFTSARRVRTCLGD